jgi:methionyl-tRNA synthetase
MANRKFYCTTPIYYVNAKPHIGTLYSTLIADVATRWNKVRGRETFFLTGTDEHGQKIAQKADELDKDPRSFVDSMIPPFKEVWSRYGFDYSHFIRTTDQSHIVAVQELLQQLIDQGDIYKSAYTGKYCTPCETFLTEEQALNRDGKILCPSCERLVSDVEEESYFFRLSAYEDQLLEFYENNPRFILPKERLNEVRGFVKQGLHDLSISRKTVKWGIPFPSDPTHTVYVWGDALTNYISAVGFGDDSRNSDFSKWWPADLHVMAKDIVRFHAVYWPAFLMAAGLPLPKKMLVHGYILMDDAKMSKSKGNVLDPIHLADTYGTDAVRYYLMRHISTSQDGNFSQELLEKTINADLANSLGNLLNRVVSLAHANNYTSVRVPAALEAPSVVLKEKARESVIAFVDEMEHHNYHMALAILWRFVADVNAYLHTQEPWRIVKENREYFEEIIAVACHALYQIGILIWPVMPVKAEELLQALGVNVQPEVGHDYTDMLRKGPWETKSFSLGPKPSALFTRIEPAVAVKSVDKPEATAPVESKTATIDDFLKIKIAVGKILKCDAVPKSEKLLRFDVSFGSYNRQILSGIAQFYRPEELEGKKALFVTNFPPRKMMGLASQGMLLSSKSSDGKLMVTIVSDDMEEGSEVG